MGFRSRLWFGCLSVVLLWSCIAARADEENSHITVLVNDSADVGPRLLAGAEKEADRIFHAAGIEISWVECETAASPCLRPPGWNEFVVHIVMSGKTSGDSVFGIAFLGENGTGNYCDVFFEKIAQKVRGSRLQVEQLLGSVVAHELGHLLLGSHSHTRWGIMVPRWQEEELREIGIGGLRFTAENSKLMRSRIGAVRVARVTVRKRIEY